MFESMNRSELQRRMIRLVNYEDGLWDITLGLVFLALGIYPLTRKAFGPELNFGLYLIFLAAVVIVQQYVRRVISIPRIGMVRNLKMKARLIVIIVAVTLVLVTLILTISTLTSQSSSPPPAEIMATPRADYTVDIIVSSAIIGIFSLIGFLLKIVRMHVYGLLIGVGSLSSTVLMNLSGLSFNLPLVIAAAVIILTGSVLLARFLRKYPIPDGEAIDANQ